MSTNNIRRLLTPVKNTPFHPQWFAFKYEKERLERIGRIVDGLVLDIGAGEKTVERYLSSNCSYISLDYLVTASSWYHTQPQVYGDAQTLPFTHEKFDCILILNVLEHLPRPQSCIEEIYRVLKPGGRVIIRVPFLYPLHDRPLDFHRWTVYGLRQLAFKYNFSVIEERLNGTSVETATLLSNIAFSHLALHHFTNILVLLLAPLIPVMVLLNNIRAWLINQFVGADQDFMPHGYEVIWEKPNR